MGSNENEQLAKTIRRSFIDFFHEEPLVVRSPGRVNIIGEHTDYNEGFVLPAAIDKFIIVAAAKRHDDEIHLYSIDYSEMYITSLEAIRKEEGKWTNYVLGVVSQLLKTGSIPAGFNLVVGGNIPIGAGMSSSAAMECAVAKALNILFGLSISDTALARMAQLAEHEFAGVQCGIMDQFASVFGKKGHAIRLDCRSLDFEYVPLNLEGYKIVLFNTNVKHSLASSEYNTRRQECEQGVEWVRKNYPEVKSLRDVTAAMLIECVAHRDRVVYRRCRYVVEENARLLQACVDLRNGDIRALGQRMLETHKGLSCDYEVSCMELDLLVDAVRGHLDVAGARMMGGGFGGCTINIVRTDRITQLSETLGEMYRRKTGLDLGTYVAETENGTMELSVKEHQQA